MIAERESAALAERLLDQTITKQHITRDQLAIHADRGSSMASKQVAQLLADLGVTKSHSRPHVSNDNPYSQSQFTTLKYRPQVPPHLPRPIRFDPGRPRLLPALLRLVQRRPPSFWDWAAGPADVHYGRAEQVRAARAEVLTAAYAAHPERFVRKLPEPPALPAVAWINQPDTQYYNA